MLRIAGSDPYLIELRGEIEGTISCSGHQQVEITLQSIDDHGDEGGLLVIMRHGDYGWEANFRLLAGNQYVPWPVEVSGGSAHYPETVVVAIENAEKISVHFAVQEKKL